MRKNYESPALIIPQQLLDLVELRMWPGTTDEANKQHINTIIPLANLKEFAPDENSIFFYPPPFTRISNALSNEYEYWKKMVRSIK